MDSFFSTAMSKLAEIEANAQFLNLAMSIIREDKSALYASYAPLGMYGGEKSARLAKALTASKVDPDSALQGLSVVASGVLEAYLASAVDTYLYRASKRGSHWSAEQSEVIRSRYLSKAGIGLEQMPSGRFYKMKFNFPRMLDNLRITLDEMQPDRISGDVFMVRFGTCSPKKIEELFVHILLGGPFDEAFGNTDFIRDWPEAGAADVEIQAQERSDFVRGELDRLASLRNDFAHGLATQSVSFADIHLFVGSIRAFLHGVADRLLVVSA